MTNIIDLIKKHRDLGEKTIIYYERTLIKIKKDLDKNSFDDLFNAPIEIIEYLKSRKLPYQLNLLCIITVALDSLVTEGKTQYKYSLGTIKTRQAIVKTKLDEGKCSIIKSDTQEKNWVSYETLQKCCKKRFGLAKKIIKRAGDLTVDDIMEIQKWVICALYVGDKENPPLRLDYINCFMANNNHFLHEKYEDMNILYIQSSRTKYFKLSEYKTKKKYGVKIIPLQPYLNRMINIWQKARARCPEMNTEKAMINSILINKKGQQISDSTMCLYLSEAFNLTKKHITVNLIRHIYITDMTQKLSYEERKRISDLMCHNLDMQIKYIKQ